MNNNIFFRRKIASKTHQYGETDGIGLQIYKCNGTYTHVKLQCTRIYTMCHFYPPRLIHKLLNYFVFSLKVILLALGELDVCWNQQISLHFMDRIP